MDHNTRAFQDPTESAFQTWQRKESTTAEQLAAVREIVLKEFAPVEKRILNTYNARTQVGAVDLKAVDSKTVIASDMQAFADSLASLQHAHKRRCASKT